MDNNATVSEKLTRIENAVDRIRVATNTGNQVIENVATFVEGHIEKPEAEDNDVIFVDYDGKRLYSYSASDFANLSALPANPTHDGLTSQGWGWTLQQAKDHVANYGSLILGQFYATTDGWTKIYITVDDMLSVSYGSYVTKGTEGSSYTGSTATIDWGDGSPTITYTGKGNLNPISAIQSVSHTYASSGDYIIKVKPADDAVIYLAGDSNGSLICSPDNKRRGYVKKIELGERCIFWPYALLNCINLETITMSLSNIYISNYALQNCHKLRCIGGRTVSLQAQPFQNCVNLQYIYSQHSDNPSSFALKENMCGNVYSLKRIIIDEQCTSIKMQAFYNCYGLEAINMPNTVTTLESSAFCNCKNLKKIKLSSALTTIGSSCFNGCVSLSVLDFSDCVAIPTLGTSAFDNMPYDKKIIVPDSLYEDWIVATNWSNYASQIVKASEA